MTLLVEFGEERIIVRLRPWLQERNLDKFAVPGDFYHFACCWTFLMFSVFLEKSVIFGYPELVPNLSQMRPQFRSAFWRVLASLREWRVKTSSGSCCRLRLDGLFSKWSRNFHRADHCTAGTLFEVRCLCIWFGGSCFRVGFEHSAVMVEGCIVTF